MLASQRQDQIHKLIKTQGAVTVASLVEHFGVSVETIRRDLLTMEKAGLLRRVHGGAVAITEMMPFHPLEHRAHAQNAQKEALARTAASLVQDGDYIAIGTGSTPMYLAQELKAKKHNLTVVTYSLDVFEILRDAPDFRLILVGGQFYPEENTFHGQLTLDTLEHLHVQKAFVFPFSISLEHGIGGYHETLCSLQKKLLQRCDQAYILADSSKFEHTALFKVAPMRPEYIYVTDPELPEALQQLYTENGIAVITREEEE